MTNFTPEMIEKARAAKTVEELLALAKENGMEMTEESAKAYFEQLHKSVELADDELDSVAGGTSIRYPCRICGKSYPQYNLIYEKETASYICVRCASITGQYNVKLALNQVKSVTE